MNIPSIASPGLGRERTGLGNAGAEEGWTAAIIVRWAVAENARGAFGLDTGLIAGAEA